MFVKGLFGEDYFDRVRSLTKSKAETAIINVGGQRHEVIFYIVKYCRQFSADTKIKKNWFAITSSPYTYVPGYLFYPGQASRDQTGKTQTGQVTGRTQHAV